MRAQLRTLATNAFPARRVHLRRCSYQRLITETGIPPDQSEAMLTLLLYAHRLASGLIVVAFARVTLARWALPEDAAESPDRLSDEAPLLAACYASSIGQRRTLGARARAPLERIGADRSASRVERRGRQQAHLEGFDLHAALRVAAQHPEGRAPLEKLLKYCARPPIAHDRLSELSDGRIALRLKTRWSDGSTHVVYEPLDFVAKLAALIPRPHKNLVLYHGVLAANSSWRPRVVRHDRCADGETSAACVSSAKRAAAMPPNPRDALAWPPPTYSACSASTACAEARRRGGSTRCQWPGRACLRPARACCDPTRRPLRRQEVEMFSQGFRPFCFLLCLGCVACEDGTPRTHALQAAEPASPPEVGAEPSIPGPALRSAKAEPAGPTAGSFERARSLAAMGGEMAVPPEASPQPGAGQSDDSSRAEPADGSAPSASAGSSDAPSEDPGPAGASGSTAEPNRVHPRAERGGALTDAYAGLARGEQQRISDLITAIDAQAASDPDDRYAVFYAGVFRLWRLAEGELTLEAVLGSLANAQDMLANLERAHELLPDDFRVTAFFGMAQVLVGGVMGDDELLDAGMATLEHAIEQEPPYGRYLRAMGLSVLPTDHEYFRHVLDDMAAGTLACKHPSGSDSVAYEYPTDGAPRSRVCLNESIVPHVWEGYFMSYGDMALKAGWDAERVRALYRSAKTSPDYEDWFYRDVLDQRIADADKGVAAFADEDPWNDPLIWTAGGTVCTGCHADVASIVAK
jgi:Putative transposase